MRTLIPLAAGSAIGYVLGAAAGRARYEQLKQRAGDLVRHPKVQQTVFDLAGEARTRASADRVPGAVAGLVETAATRVQDSVTQPGPAPVVTEPTAGNEA